MTWTLVLFDIDGTLLDARGTGRWAMARAFEDVFRLADGDAPSRKVAFDGMTDRTIMKAIGRNAEVPVEAIITRGGDLQDAFLRRLEEGLAAAADKRALPGVVDLLDGLSGVHRAAVGLCTGNMRRGAFMKLASVGLSDYFEIGGFGDDAEDRSVIARLVRERFEARLGVDISPRNVVLIGDSVADIASARNNGYRSIAVGTGWTSSDLLMDARPDVFLDDLTGFGGIMQFIFGSRG